jgi:hypothetical protein
VAPAVLEEQLARAAGANPSLSSFLPTVNPACRVDDERRDAAIAASGFDVAKTMKRSASLPLVIQSLRPVIANPSPRSAGARRQREGIAAGAGFRQRVRTNRCVRERGQARCFCVSLPQRSTALTTSVFCTSTRTPIDGSTRRERFDGEHRMEEGAARAAVCFGYFDAHDVQREEAIEERTRDLARLIHLTDEAGGSP